ncbi:DegV family protein [Tenuibacillus multivorans]|uniref:EDD domain protein, DegV family n=1 Tax=Tenuibacillus multivorans TaxID=237069 RepID=A0A1G9ZZ41_9BACI|nr:DegV family protein [Tenuibacillus multivorans]GEL76911.1 DegV domain-containing protein YitS [Tenuibacillus multivorans]SDN26709.1 EDD domain protein, DegV family [Tenuibacillus multivorans]
MNVQIVIDSASDLPKSILEDYQLESVPLIVHLDDQDYLDGETIEPKMVYDAMREGKSPKTAQATPESFYNVFKKHAEQGKAIIYLAFSSELSGTYQSAVIAKDQVLEELPEADIYCIDTRAASLGCGLIAYHAAQLAQDNADVQDILDLANHYVNNMEHIFTVDDLEYLQRGGRVSKAQAFVGSLLKIKPLLHVDDGKLVPLEKIRGSKKVLRRMVDVMKERGEDFQNQTIAITHGDDEENASKLKNLIQEELSPKDVIIHTIGSAIGAHAGPGTIALFFLNKVKK